MSANDRESGSLQKEGQKQLGGVAAAASPWGKDPQAPVLLLGYNQSRLLAQPLLSTAGALGSLLDSGGDHLLQGGGPAPSRASPAPLWAAETWWVLGCLCASCLEAVSRLRGVVNSGVTLQGSDGHTSTPGRGGRAEKHRVNFPEKPNHISRAQRQEVPVNLSAQRASRQSLLGQQRRKKRKKESSRPQPGISASDSWGRRASPVMSPLRLF